MIYKNIDILDTFFVQNFHWIVNLFLTEKSRGKKNQEIIKDKILKNIKFNYSVTETYFKMSGAWRAAGLK